MGATKQQRPQGRMIRVTVSEDAGVNRLSDGAARLFFMLKPHLNAHGKFSGGPHTIRENIVPLLPWSAKRINGYLVEINKHTSVRVWKQFGRFYVHDLAFSSEQDIREDRKGQDLLPPYPGPEAMKPGTSENELPELLLDLVPDQLPHEVEVEVKEKEKKKLKSDSSPSALMGAEASSLLEEPTPEEREATLKMLREATRKIGEKPGGEERGNGKGVVEDPILDLCKKLPKAKYQAVVHAFGMFTHSDPTKRWSKEQVDQHLEAGHFEDSDYYLVEPIFTEKTPG